MSRILLVDVEPHLSTLFRRLGPDHGIEEVPGEEEGLARLRAEPDGIDAIVIGSTLPDPVGLTQHLSSVRKDLPVMILSEPHSIGSLRRDIKFAPLLTRPVYCESTDEREHLMDSFRDLADRIPRQKRYRSMLLGAREKMQAATAGRKRSDLYLATLLNSLPTGVVLLDQEGRVLEWNHAAASIFGLSRGTRPGIEAAELVAGTARAALTSVLEEAASGGHGGETLLEIDDHGGARRYLDLRSAPVRDRGQLVGRILSVTDVTERIRLHQHARQLQEHKAVNDALAMQADELRRLNETLQQSNEELEAFAYVASHDLQEPLRKINAFTDLLRADYGPVLRGDGEFYLDRLQDAAGRMIELIRGLLTYSRIASRGAPFREIDLDRVVERVLSDLEVSVRENEARIEAERLPVLEADPIQMRQLFQNLIGNSIKFRRDDVPPHITITREDLPAGAKQPESVVIRLRDNGVGFDMKHRDRVFAPFHRLHGRGKYAGTGMGLAICRRIVQRHGGSISVESAPGQGSEFTIVLPKRHEDA